MILRSTVSILGVYDYDNTVFDSLKIPDAVSRETLIGEICRNCAELELLYHDPDVLRPMIGYWSANMYPIWEELEKTLHYEYNPIENYDRREDWSDDNVSETAGQSSGSATNKGAGNVSVKTAAFNSPAGDLKTRDVTDTTDTATSSSSSNITSNSSSGSKHSGRLHGNIGVTTTQAMIREQRDVVRYSIINEIVNDFKHEFCVLIY